jgi:hypothetical protein
MSQDHGAMVCRKCEGTNIEVWETPELTHYGKFMCADCGTFNGWAPKPAENKHDRPKRNKKLYEKYGKNFCQLCLRDSGIVGSLPSESVLEVHHVIAVKEGGADSPENLWTVCTDCHKLIHARRLELSKYLFEIP